MSDDGQEEVVLFMAALVIVAVLILAMNYRS